MWNVAGGGLYKALWSCCLCGLGTNVLQGQLK